MSEHSERIIDTALTPRSGVIRGGDEGADQMIAIR
jgi:hypothetical protein